MQKQMAISPFGFLGKHLLSFSVWHCDIMNLVLLSLNFFSAQVGENLENQSSYWKRQDGCL